jgi:hypothetical protein
VVSLAKWRILNRLHDRNETLYYRVSHPLLCYKWWNRRLLFLS